MAKRDRARLPEAGDIGTVIGYLRLLPSSEAAQGITGLSETAIWNAITGRVRVDTETRRHLATVAGVVEMLEEARDAATGLKDRGMSADQWLENARIETSQGIKAPVEILADQTLSEELLRELRR